MKRGKGTYNNDMFLKVNFDIPVFQSDVFALKIKSTFGLFDHDKRHKFMMHQIYGHDDGGGVRPNISALKI